MNRERKECQAAALRLLIENKLSNPCVICKYKLDKMNLLYLFKRCLLANVLILHAYCGSFLFFLKNLCILVLCFEIALIFQICHLFY